MTTINLCAEETTVCDRDGNIRLAGGRHSGEGKLEMCRNGVWGTICNRGWDDIDAQVACTELSLNSAVNFQGLLLLFIKYL